MVNESQYGIRYVYIIRYIILALNNYQTNEFDEQPTQVNGWTGSRPECVQERSLHLIWYLVLQDYAQIVLLFSRILASFHSNISHLFLYTLHAELCVSLHVILNSINNAK